VAPSQRIPAVRLDKDGNRVVGPVRWGLIPHWAKTLPKVQPINARCETASTSNMFKQAMQRRRCIIPADGFYEWKKLDSKTKQPMFIRFPDDRVFGFAGLWERWKPDDTSEAVDTCTIITTTPNELMASIHDRMPVILKPQDYDRWLDRDRPAEDVVDLLRPYPDGELEAHPVSTAVNSPKNDQPSNVEPVNA
jgi:putative SOS response-associated peptidase YedK